MGNIQPDHQALAVHAIHPGPDEEPKERITQVAVVARSSAEPLSLKTSRGSTADGVAASKGIPYAALPFGPNRFQPPRPAESW